MHQDAYPVSIDRQTKNGSIRILLTEMRSSQFFCPDGNISNQDKWTLLTWMQDLLKTYESVNRPV